MIEAIRKLLSVGLPMAASRFLDTFNTFIVMLLLAQLGHVVLAASYSIATIRIVMLVIFMSPLFCLAAIVAREYAKNDLDEENSNALIMQGWIVALLLSIVPCVLLYFLQDILFWLHQPVDLVPIIGEYFYYYMWAIPAIYLSVVNQQFLVGIKKQKLALVASIIVVLLSIIANAGLIFGYFWLPRLEVAGAGIASIIASWFGLIFSTILIFKFSKCSFNLTRWRNFFWGKLIFKIGIPIGVNAASDLLLMFVIMIMTGWLGSVAMSASQISSEYLFLVVLPLFGLSEGCAVVVGHNLQKKDKTSLLAFSRAGFFLSTSFILIVAFIVLIFHKQLADAFIDFSSHDALIIYNLAMWLLALRILKMFIAGPGLIFSGLLKGLYDTVYPMFLSIVVNWGVTLPTAAVFAFKLNFGVRGIVLASILAEFILTILLFARWKFSLYARLNI